MNAFPLYNSSYCFSQMWAFHSWLTVSAEWSSIQVFLYPCEFDHNIGCLLQLILHHLLCGRHACHFCIGLCILLSSMQLLISVQWKRNIDTISWSIIVTQKGGHFEPLNAQRPEVQDLNKLMNMQTVTCTQTGYYTIYLMKYL
jgi:hypothetical protein